MFDHIAMNRRPGDEGWQVTADGVDITDEIVGWEIEPASGPNTSPKLWIAVMPTQLIVDSKRCDGCGPTQERRGD